MAFTGSPTSSTEYARQIAGKTPWQDLADGKAKFTYTHAAGAGVGEVNLIWLPAGRITVYHTASLVRASQMVATADLHVGHRAYYDPVAGATVAEDDNEWLDNADTGGGAIDSALLLPAAPAAFTTYNTQGGLIVYALIDTANIEDGDTINGFITYSVG